MYFEIRHVARFFLWGGAFGERSEPTRPKQLRSERSEQAVAGVWGRSPLAGARGAHPPGKISRNRVFKTAFGIKEICTL